MADPSSAELGFRRLEPVRVDYMDSESESKEVESSKCYKDILLPQSAQGPFRSVGPEEGDGIFFRNY